jgi:hypothetical protein
VNSPTYVMRMYHSKEPRTIHRPLSEIPASRDLTERFRELQRLRKQVRALELRLSSNSSTSNRRFKDRPFE